MLPPSVPTGGFYAEHGSCDVNLLLSGLKNYPESVSAFAGLDRGTGRVSWRGEASKLACAGRASGPGVNARALTEALDAMRDLGSLHVTLPLFASTGLVDTFKQLALHHVRSGPSYAPLTCTASRMLMLMSPLLRSSGHHATAGLRLGVKPGSAVTRADLPCISGLFGTITQLPHLESWQDAQAESHHQGTFQFLGAW